MVERIHQEIETLKILPGRVVYNDEEYDDFREFSRAIIKHLRITPLNFKRVAYKCYRHVNNYYINLAETEGAKYHLK